MLQDEEDDLVNIFGTTPEEDEAMSLLEASFAEDDDSQESLAEGNDKTESFLEDTEAEADGLEKVIGRVSLPLRGCYHLLVGLSVMSC